jgi:hypothetical protein
MSDTQRRGPIARRLKLVARLCARSMERLVLAQRFTGLAHTACRLCVQPNPSPVRVLTPEEGDAATTSWPCSRRFFTSFFPMSLLPPITTIFMAYLLVCHPQIGDEFVTAVNLRHTCDRRRRTPWMLGRARSGGLKPMVRGYAAILREVFHDPCGLNPVSDDFVAFEASPDSEISPTLSRSHSRQRLRNWTATTCS